MKKAPPLLWNFRACLGASSLMLLLAGCGEKRSEHLPVAQLGPPISARAVLDEMGLRETALGRGVLFESMTIANRLIQDQVILRVVPTWSELEVNFDADEPPVLVPVITVSSESLPSKSLAFVPRDRSCIIVNGEQVSSLLDDLPPESVSGSTREELLPYLWAVILLHELGHVFFSDHTRGAMLAAGDGELNLARDANKLAEFRCDHFAAMQVRMCLVPGSRGDWATGLAPEVEHDAAARYMGGPVQGQDDGMKMIHANTILLAVMTVAHDYWNEISEKAELAPKNLFWDRGYSHPNLRLRFLYMASVMNPSSQPYRVFLEQMLAIRDQRAYDVLYRAEYTGLPRSSEVDASDR